MAQQWAPTADRQSYSNSQSPPLKVDPDGWMQDEIVGAPPVEWTDGPKRAMPGQRSYFDAEVHPGDESYSQDGEYLPQT